MGYLPLNICSIRAEERKVHRGKVWIGNPFVFFMFLSVLLATFFQSGCAQVASIKGSASPSDPAQVIPSILTQPASQTVTAGQAATFSVTATGTAPLSYHWRKNGISIGGATAATYTTAVAATSDSGSQFSVVVSNSTGSVTSNTVTLTVTTAAVAPSILTQPASQTLNVGQTATFSVTASGTAPLNYQWLKNGTTISGATLASYTTPATTASDSGSQFTVTVSNSIGAVTSNIAALTINATPVAIAVSPEVATVTIGNTQQFLGTVTGNSNTAVAWSVSGAGCVGAACGTISASGLYAPPASIPSPGIVAVKATSLADPTKSASATVTILAVVSVFVSISPTSAAVPVTGAQLFRASVAGTSNTAVSWSLRGPGCSGSACGTLSTSASSVVYSAPIVAPSPATVSVVANSVADPTKSAAAGVTIDPTKVVVNVTPTDVSVTTGSTQQFVTSVAGTSNTAVAWTVSGTGCSGTACGTISSSGLYTSPKAEPTSATVTITATSVSDPTSSASAKVTIVPPQAAGYSSRGGHIFDAGRLQDEF